MTAYCLRCYHKLPGARGDQYCAVCVDHGLTPDEQIDKLRDEVFRLKLQVAELEKQLKGQHDRQGTVKKNTRSDGTVSTSRKTAHRDQRADE
jgi:hypothetical protein